MVIELALREMSDSVPTTSMGVCYRVLQASARIHLRHTFLGAVFWRFPPNKNKTGLMAGFFILYFAYSITLSTNPYFTASVAFIK